MLGNISAKTDGRIKRDTRTNAVDLKDHEDDGDNDDFDNDEDNNDDGDDHAVAPAASTATATTTTITTTTITAMTTLILTPRILLPAACSRLISSLRQARKPIPTRMKMGAVIPRIASTEVSSGGRGIARWQQAQLL